MPAIFFLPLPPIGEPGAASETRSPVEAESEPRSRSRGSFDGGFDRFGFASRSAYPDMSGIGRQLTSSPPPHPGRLI